MTARMVAPLAGAQPGGQGGALNLIHRNKSPNPALARVSGRFDLPEGAPGSLLSTLLNLPFPLAVEVLRRHAK